MRRWLLELLLASGVAGLAHSRRALTIDGAVAAALLGSVVFGRGRLPASAALLTFFTSSSALSLVGRDRKVAQAKGARRDAWQVLANGGPATLWLLGGGRLAQGGFVGGLAAAAADTWATEVGMLASTAPRLITTLQPVEPGTSGGVTPQGLLASLGGALAVGLGWTALGGQRRGLPIAVATGVAGGLVDSLLGATVQATYRCGACGARTEEPIHRRCGASSRLVGGYVQVTNDVVNAAATLFAATLGARLWRA